MGVYTRPDSKYYWLWLERKGTMGLRERTQFLASPENRSLVERLYKQRMRQLAHAESFAPQGLKGPRADLGGWCYIYFISDGQRIKIGRAVNVQNRLRAMQTGHPKPLMVLAAFVSHHKTEALIHRRFRRNQIKRGTEWFVPSAELLAFIDRIKGGDPMAELLNHFQSAHDPGKGVQKH